MLGKYIWLMCYISFVLCKETQKDLTTVFIDLQPLLRTRKNVTSDLENVIDRRKKALNIVERELQRFKEEHNKAMEGPKKYFSDPGNKLTLLTRLTYGLNILEKLIKETALTIRLKRQSSLLYPTIFDFDESIRSLLRLQMVYKLNVTEISDGILRTNFTEDGKVYTEYSLPMTADDCFEISKGINKRKQYKIAVSWLIEALRKYDLEKPFFTLKKVDIVQEISTTYNKLDDARKYIEWTEKLIKLKPPSQRDDYEIYIQLKKRELLVKKTMAKEMVQDEQDVKPTKKAKKPRIDPVKVVNKCGTEKMTEVYKMLCRGEMKVSSKITKKLKCWYHTGYHPFLRLAPIKAEQLFETPDITMFYDVMSDNEINTIKNMSIPGLRDGATGYGDPYKRYPFTPKMVHRICKSTFLKEKSDVISRFTQRITDFSGFTLARSEFLHVSNYGTSGFFIPHYDFWMHNHFLETYGNRMATVIAYMSDVEQGGATVFLPFGLTVFPKKGAALLWNNLNPSHQGDRLICHGACPVLRGSKWISQNVQLSHLFTVATQWISTLEQELRRPCALGPETRKSSELPYPEPRYVM